MVCNVIAARVKYGQYVLSVVCQLGFCQGLEVYFIQYTVATTV